jgi:phage gp36-like protein
VPYSTYDDVLVEIRSESVLIDLTDNPDDPTGDVDVSKVESAIADADGVIDAHLAARYSVPLSTVPQSIKTISAKIAAYFLYARSEAITDGRREQFKYCDDLLKQMSKGILIPADASISAGGAPIGDSPDRDFTEEVLDEY